MKLKRLVSAVLAVGMALTMLPTAAFAAADPTPVTPIEITNLKFDADGYPIVPAGQEDTTYIYSENGKQQYAVANKRTYLAIRKDHMLVGPSNQIIKASINTVGTLNGGVYGGTVTIADGVIQNGLFQKKVQYSASNKTGAIFGGVFSNDVGAAGERTLTATGCSIYTEESKQVSEDAYISNTAYIVGNQKMVLALQALAQSGWKVNGVELDMKNPTNTVLQDVSVSSDENDVNYLAFTMPQEDVTIEPIVDAVEFKLGANGMPEYKGKEYLGNLQLDGWHLSVTDASTTLRIEEGCTVDLGNHRVDWVIGNYGTLKNGVTPGNVVNRQNEDGTRGRVENIAFRMNVRFDQDSPISWLTLHNATACDVFTEIVGVIGQQTLTVKATVSPFDGWSYSGKVSEEVAKQIDAQKNNETLTLTLNGENADTIALTAKTTGDTFDMTLVDGTASIDGKEVTAAQKGQTVTLTAAEAPEGMVFDRWEITPADVALTLEEGGFDSHAATASFKMPAQTLNIRAMYRMADQPEEPDVLGTVATIATVGVGAAVVGYTGYMIGTELYLNTVLPDGVAIPQNTTELAKLLWTEAGKPAPAAVMAEDATDEQKALTWAVENQLISADKAADASVTRWEVIDAWNKVQEMKG